MNNKELSMLINDVCTDYSVEGNGKFEKFKEFKIRWSRSETEIQFVVPDYLKNAPKEIINELIKCTLEKIYNDNEEISEIVREYLTSPQFRKANQEKYWDRHNAVDISDAEHVSFRKILNNLKKIGLIPMDLDIHLKLIPSSNHKMAQTSVMMHSIMINKKLDRDDIPEFVLEYMLYKNASYIMCGLHNNDPDKHREILNKYPMCEEAEKWLAESEFY